MSKTPTSKQAGDDGLLAHAATLKVQGHEVITAVVYRTAAKALKPDIEKDSYNEPDEPQFELCVFSDGRVAQRWMVGKGSSVWWDDLQDLYKVHIYAHPDYGTRVEWSNGKVEEL